MLTKYTLEEFYLYQVIISFKVRNILYIKIWH